VDPAPHRVGYPTRAAVLVAFLAAHGILAKHLYAHPPIGVTVDEAQAGAMLMYYAGDLVDLVIIVLLCRRWYAATRPRPVERSGALRTVRVAPFTEKTGATHTFG
jgi:putative membrane protein